MAKLHNPILTIFLVAVVGLAVVWVTFGPFIWAIAKHSVRQWRERLPFESGDWKNPDLVYGEKPVRVRMVDDLLRQHKLKSKHVSDLYALLGPPLRRPEYTFYSADEFARYIGEHDLVYWLGPERQLFSFDSEWLVFTIASDGTVKEYRIVHGGAQGIRNFDCASPYRLSIESQASSRYSLAIREPSEPSELEGFLIALEYYSRKCNPSWRDRWTAELEVQDSSEHGNAVQFEFDRASQVLTRISTEGKKDATVISLAD